MGFGQGAGQATFQRIAQVQQTRGFMVDVAQQIKRSGHAHNACQVLGAATAATLLAAQRLCGTGHALAQQQRTDTLGALKLVCRQGHRVGTEAGEMKRQLANPLGGIHMQQSACGLRQLGHFSHGHQHPGFVVGRHERDQRHVRPDQAGSSRQVKRTIGLDWNQVYL